MTGKETPEQPKSRPETVPERYAREAKARLAARMGQDIAEEYTSVAASTPLNAQNVAELMAAAYLQGYADGKGRKPLKLRPGGESNLGNHGIGERDEVLQ
jgi:hypothetical protein